MTRKDIMLTMAAMTAGAMSTEGYDYYKPHIKKGSSSKEYKHKNQNIEYYLDEKGNMRKRKKKKGTI